MAPCAKAARPEPTQKPHDQNRADPWPAEAELERDAAEDEGQQHQEDGKVDGRDDDGEGEREHGKQSHAA